MTTPIKEPSAVVHFILFQHDVQRPTLPFRCVQDSPIAFFVFFVYNICIKILNIILLKQRTYC